MHKSVLAAVALLLAGPLLLAQRPGSRDSDTDPPAKIGGKSMTEWDAEFKSSDASRRTRAVETVPLFGENARHFVPLLINSTRDKDTSPRIKAVAVLGAIEIDDKHKAKVIDALVKRVSWKSEGQSAVRYAAAVSIGRFAGEAQSGIPTFIEGTRDAGSWEIRNICIVLLVQATAESKKSPDRAVDALLTVLRLETTAQVKFAAIRGLAAVGRPADPGKQQLVLKTLHYQANLPGKGSNRILAIWSYAALVGLESSATSSDVALKALSKHLSKKEYIDVRVNAAGALGSLGIKAKSQTPALIALLADPEPVIITSACLALASIGDNSNAVLAGIKDVLGHENQSVVLTGLQVLLHLKMAPAAIVPALERQMARSGIKEEQREFLRRAIVEIKKIKKDKK